MSIIDTLILALIQGLTEFLPVSSSGHLVLANALLGVHEPGIVTEMTLHLGTLLAVVLYYRRDLLTMARSFLPSAPAAGQTGRATGRRLLFLLVVGTVPAVVAGLLLRDRIEALYENPREASYELLVTAGILVATAFVRPGRRPMNAWRSLVVGVWQAAALLPGVSRSGATIAGSLFLGVDRGEAARFSFLLSIPAIAGAALLQVPAAVREVGAGMAPQLIVGFTVSFLIGYATITFLLRIVRGGRFWLFGLYCALIGAVGLLLFR